MKTPAIPGIGRLLKAAGIIGAGCLVYLPVLHGGWVWDDDVEITGNTSLRAPGALWRMWFHPWQADYLPVKSLLQWIQWNLWGEHPSGYHVTNACLHIVSALLLWRLLGRLGVRFAWLGGLIFAVHPLAVESVAWISELKNALSLPLLLLAFDAYLDWDGSGPAAGGRARRRYVASLLWFAAALLSKGSVVMMPVILLLYCWWRRGRLSSGDFRAAAPFLALSLAAGIVTIRFQLHRAMAGEAIAIGGAASRMAGAGLAAVFYLWKSVIPSGLMPIYPRWAIDPPAVWQFWPWAGLAAAAAMLLAWGRTSPGRARTARTIAFGFGFFLVNLLPVLGFVPMSILRLTLVADHLAYLPLVGLVGLAAAGIGSGETWLRGRGAPGNAAVPSLWIIVAAAIAAFAAGARAYAAVYSDAARLWTYEVSRYPAAWAAHNNLGNAFMDAERVADAQAQYETALKIRPDYVEACNNLANIYSKTGRLAEAAVLYHRALGLKPDYPQARNGLGNLLSQEGDLRGSMEQLSLAIRYSPDMAAAYNNMGNTYCLMGRYAEAEGYIRKALEISPNEPEAHNNLGNVYVRTGRADIAMGEYRTALRLKPDFVEAVNNIGNVQMMAGRLQEAFDTFSLALRIRPGYAEALFNRGLVLLAAGRRDDAATQFRQALQSRPDFAQARAKLELLEKK